MSRYEKYKLQWMLDHGYGLSDLLVELDELRFADPENSNYISNPLLEIFADWEFERGFGGEIWACEEEWKECEYRES